jgi:hypothetical protein
MEVVQEKKRKIQEITGAFVQENHGKKSGSISTTDGIKSLDTSY